MHDNLIILAGGMSSRMKKPSTLKAINKEETHQANNRNKSLISVGNSGRPLMDYLLFNAKKAGYKNIYIVINEQGGLFKEFYGQQKAGNHFNGLNISFPIQYIPNDRVKPFGTADAVFQAVEQFPELQSEQFTICNSANLYTINSLKLLRETDYSNAFISYDRATLAFSLEKIYSFAILNLNEKNYLKNIIEKPSFEEAKTHQDKDGKIRVSMNLFKFDGKTMYPYLKNCPVHPERKEKELPTVVLNCVAEHPESFYGIPLSEHVPDLTAKDDIIVLKEYINKHFPEKLSW